MASAGDLEKVTVNLAPVDLGRIDLLVREGFYQNRTDFIRTSIRNQIQSHAQTVDRTVSRRTMTLGLRHFSRSDLERVRESGELLDIRVVGLASIEDDVTPELALNTIGSVTVLGTFRASREVRDALRERIRST